MRLERNQLTKGPINHAHKAGPQPKDYGVTVTVFKEENDMISFLFCVILVTMVGDGQKERMWDSGD